MKQTRFVAWCAGLALLLTGASALKCISCDLNSQSTCENGTAAKANTRLLVECQENQDFCQVSLTQKKDDKEPSGWRTLELSRSCGDHAEYFCSDKADVGTRSCLASCTAEECNVFDAAAVVKRGELYEKLLNEAARLAEQDGVEAVQARLEGGGGDNTGLIIGIVVLAVAVLALIIALVVVRSKANRSGI